MGVVRLESDAASSEAVYVDGHYAGIVDDFDGAWDRDRCSSQGLTAFEIVAPGHEQLTFEVNVVPNQTIDYRGDMLRAAP